ncbi:MAG: Ham1 family, partial [Planctomycetota bacterium]
LPQSGRGFAELEPEEKDAVSHRGRALDHLAELLPGALREA